MMRFNKLEADSCRLQVTGCPEQDPALQKAEVFRAPDDGITTSLRQSVKGEVVVVTDI